MAQWVLHGMGVFCLFVKLTSRRSLVSTNRKSKLSSLVLGSSYVLLFTLGFANL